jgi:hypothetical protein
VEARAADAEESTPKRVLEMPGHLKPAPAVSEYSASAPQPEAKAAEGDVTR